MNWSFKIVRIAGIDVYIHWTFTILIVWLVGIHLSQGNDWTVALRGVGFVLSIFACVVLHELGHALCARRYGIRTRDITLLPIGGVARLEKMPDEPRQELFVALAGPAVNVAIAVVLLAVLYFLHGLTALGDVQLVEGNFIAELMIVNAALAIFNLLPAFPMDGGRVLRAILAQRMDYVQATQIAANVGQMMAIVFGLLGLFSNFFLIFIALFVYIGAQQEAQVVQVRALMQGVPVRQAMVTRFRAVTPQTDLSDLIGELIAGEQQDFPVVEDGTTVGVLTRNEIVAAVSEGRAEAKVGEVMRTSCEAVDDREMLQDTFQRMQEAQCSSLPVERDGELVGLITLENIGEWMMLRSAMRQAQTRRQFAQPWDSRRPDSAAQ